MTMTGQLLRLLIETNRYQSSYLIKKLNRKTKTLVHGIKSSWNGQLKQHKSTYCYKQDQT